VMVMSNEHLYYLLGWSLSRALKTLDDMYTLYMDLKTINSCIVNLSLLEEQYKALISQWMNIISNKLFNGERLTEHEKIKITKDLTDIEEAIRRKLGL